MFVILIDSSRTLGMIRYNAYQYRQACETHMRKIKPSAAPFKNCVNNPLLDLPDETPVSRVLAPIELHLLSGNTNRLYDFGNTVLTNLDATVSMDLWNKSLGFDRPKLHSGQFKGGQCSKLLENTDLLENLLKSSLTVVPAQLSDLIRALSALNQAKNTCFGLRLDKSYKEKIKLYKEAYKTLGIKVSPKVHALVIHVPEFLDSMQESYPDKGLGFWSEQASETVHYDFKQFYEQGYKIPSCHNLYSAKLLRSVIVYNSRHSHFKI